MGQAKQRGSFEQRRQAALEKGIEKEVARRQRAIDLDKVRQARTLAAMAAVAYGIAPELPRRL